MERPWHYLSNQFLSVTENTFKKALKMSNYHDARLKKVMDDNPGDPDYATLYNRYHPLHVIYGNEYSKWKNAGGQQEGHTLNVDQLLQLLITKINTWDVQVQGVFAKTTPAYKAIFPNGHAPFVKGDKVSRIQALTTLASALNPHAALAATKAEVVAFHLLIDEANDTQQGAKGDTGAASTDVDIARIEIMLMQYGNLGFLMNKFRETPDYIATFFELIEIRNHQQNIFTGTLTEGENEGALVHTFVADDQIRIKITGTGQANIFLASSPNGTNSTAIVAVGGTDIVHTISEFAPADYGTHRYITLVNNSPGANELHYEIELL